MNSSVGLSLPEYSFNTTQTVVIIGAGLAGCAIAHAMVKRGYSCKVFDKNHSIAGSTSALPAAVVRPAVSGDEFFKSYFDYAFDFCCQTLDKKLFTQCGSLELTTKADTARTDTTNRAIYSGTYQREFIDATAASTLAGNELNSSAIHIEDAGFINPQLLCEHWLQHEACEFHGDTPVDALRKTQHGWQLLSESGAVIDESQIVVLATADHTDLFDVATELPLQRALGQIDLFEHQGPPLQRIVNSDGYLLPIDAGIWCGATHHPVECASVLTDEHSCGSASRSSNHYDRGVSDADTQANKAKAANILPKLRGTGLPVASFAACRTFTPDRLPIVGALHNSLWYRQQYADLRHGKPAHHYPRPDFHQGLYLAAGLGSRGATQALLIGELIGDLISGIQQKDDLRNQLHREFLQSLHPARFLIRAVKRGL